MSIKAKTVILTAFALLFLSNVNPKKLLLKETVRGYEAKSGFSIHILLSIFTWFGKSTVEGLFVEQQLMMAEFPFFLSIITQLCSFPCEQINHQEREVS